MLFLTASISTSKAGLLLATEPLLIGCVNGMREMIRKRIISPVHLNVLSLTHILAQLVDIAVMRSGRPGSTSFLFRYVIHPVLFQLILVTVL